MQKRYFNINQASYKLKIEAVVSTISIVTGKLKLK